ncbi:DUF4097 family beta strand repeat-containing protein [Neobacillus mesonae]|uniref:LiaG family protein n=1 Tax=Neobacillus mesonae TaxID=1193713 RepID=UPI00203ED924|nr:DUF4097 family beta strand repeat-containing protein [Neobacillus mesonae]MCM3569733.1 DUF4097 domain-containing protein [Neobacillus mesonae]
MKRILVLFLVITGVYILVNQSFQSGWFGLGNEDGKAAVTNNVKVIKVDVENVNTEIIPEDRTDLKAVYHGKQKLIVTEQGNLVEVSLKKKWFDWFNFPSFSQKNRLKIYIPEDYDRNMALDLGSGNINFYGPEKNKPMNLDVLDVEIDSGNLNLSNMKVKQFKHDVSSGNAAITSLTAKSSNINIDSGNTTLIHYSGAIKADISSGRLKVQLDKLNDAIDVDVSSGLTELDLPDDADFTLNGEVSSGFIKNDFPLSSNTSSKKHIKGIHGTGKYKIDLDVSSGILRIY